MRILVDTNVVIPLENSTHVLEDSLSKLVRLDSENGHQLIVHPSSYDDIEHDSDTSRRAISQSLIKKYPILENPPELIQHEIHSLSLSQLDDNDRVDNDILYALHRDSASILVIEDRSLHNAGVPGSSPGVATNKIKHLLLNKLHHIAVGDTLCHIF